jgi:hypothetical protein
LTSTQTEKYVITRYNSIVFTSRSSNVSIVLTVTPSFLNGSTLWNNDTLNGYATIPYGTFAYNMTVGPVHGSNWAWNAVQHLQNDYVQNRGSYQQLNNYDCFKRSTNMFSWRPNFLLVSDDPDWRYGLNSTVLNWSLNFPPQSSGLCEEHPGSGFSCQDIQKLTLTDFDHWIYNNNSIQYCLVSTSSFNKEEVDTCHLQCAPIIMLGMFKWATEHARTLKRQWSRSSTLSSVSPYYGSSGIKTPVSAP